MCARILPGAVAAGAPRIGRAIHPEVTVELPRNRVRRVPITGPRAAVEAKGMRGIITTRHLVTNAPTIIHEFGMVAYLRCVRTALLSRRPVTFLECVMRCSQR